MCNVFHAQTLYVTADILSGSGAEHSSEMKFGQSAHRAQRVGIQYLRQMTVDVHYYVLNHLMMKAACLLLLPPSVQCGKAFVQYLPQLFRRIVRVCVFIIFICIFYPDVDHFPQGYIDNVFPILQTVITKLITPRTVGVGAQIFLHVEAERHSAALAISFIYF